MIYYHLNMARGFVMPLELRRKWLHWVALYLVLMAAAIALLLHQVVSKIVFLRSQHSLSAAQEEKWLGAHPEYKTLDDYKKALRKEVSASVRDLDSILTFGRDQGRVASILLSVMETLPSELGMGALNYEVETGKMDFEVFVPAALTLERKISPPMLVSLWEKHPLLSKSLTQIVMGNSERVRKGKGEVMCWRFSAVIGEAQHD